MHKPSVVLSDSDSHTQGLVSFVPNFFNLNMQEAIKSVNLEKDIPLRMNKVKGEYLFLLDRSYSMDGTRIVKAKEALLLFLKSLPQESYFNVVSFGNKHKFLFEQS